MTRSTILGLFLCLAVSGPILAGGTGDQRRSSLKRYELSEPHMGTTFTIILYAQDRPSANRAFRAAFARVAELNAIFSDYESDSESRILAATAPHDRFQAMSLDLTVLMAHSVQISKNTNGAFDVTIGPLSKQWRRAHRQRRLPTPNQLAAAKKSAGYKNIQLKDGKARLLQADMRLDFGGIAKGYTVDEVLELLNERGIESALVNAGGDIGVAAAPPGETGWKVAIAGLHPNNPPRRLLLPAYHSIATSGDLWKSVTIDGTRYSHLVDPRTGMGTTTPTSVSVVNTQSFIADALASAICVMGPEAGQKLVEQLYPNASLYVVQKPGSELKTYRSKDFPEFQTDENP